MRGDTHMATDLTCYSQLVGDTFRLGSKLFVRCKADPATVLAQRSQKEIEISHFSRYQAQKRIVSTDLKLIVF